MNAPTKAAEVTPQVISFMLDGKPVTSCLTPARLANGKKIQVLLKGSKIKVQGAIQEEKVRVSGTKRDDLQAAMALIKAENADFPLSFNNFRD